jgi:hypothetical protein
MTSQLAMRIKARKDAELAYSLCLDVNTENREYYWKCLLELIQDIVPKQENTTELVPMTDQEVTQFRRYEMDFGKYCGREIKDVPLDYLDYLIGQPDNLTPFRRYLKNPSIAKLLQQQLDEGRNYD